MRPPTTSSFDGQATFLITLGLVLVAAWMTLHVSQPSTPHPPSLIQQAEITTHVALVETGGSHDEVTAALYYAIGSVPGVHTTMYLALPRFGIENVFAWIRRRYKLSPYTISKPYLFSPNDANAPDTIFLATCEHDVFAADTVLHYNFEHGPKSQTLVCVMHHPDRFKSVEEHVRRWARSGRLRFITLSTHTAKLLRTEVNKFGDGLYEHIPIDAFPPIFPAPLTPNLPPSDR